MFDLKAIGTVVGRLLMQTDRRALWYMVTNLMSKSLAAVAQLAAIAVFLRLHSQDAAALIFLVLGYATWLQLFEFGLAQTLQNKFNLRTVSIHETSIVVWSHYAVMWLIAVTLYFTNAPASILLPSGKSGLTTTDYQAFSAGAALMVLCSTNVIVHRVLIIFHKGWLSNTLISLQSIIIILLLAAYYSSEEPTVLRSILIYMLPQVLVVMPFLLFLLRRLHRRGRSRRVLASSSIFRDAAGYFALSGMSSVLLGMDYFIGAHYLDSSEIVAYHVVTRFFYVSFIVYYAYAIYAARRVSNIHSAESLHAVSRIRKTSILMGFFSVLAVFFLVLFSSVSGLINYFANGLVLQKELLVVALVYFLLRVYCDTGVIILGNLSFRKNLLLVYAIQIMVCAPLMFILARPYGAVGILAALAAAYLVGAFVQVKPWRITQHA